MPKRKRLYSLFEQQDGQWVRISKLALPKESAVRTFQNALLAPYLYPTEDVKGLRELGVVTEGDNLMPPKELTNDEINALLALVNENKFENERVLEYESLPASRAKDIVRQLLRLEQITEKLLGMLT